MLARFPEVSVKLTHFLCCNKKSKERFFMNTALVVIDVQNDYFPGGRMELAGSLDAAVKIRELLGFFRSRGLPVIHIRHVSARPGAAFFLPGTAGAEFHDHARPLKDEKVFVKNYPNSFRETGLHEHLKENNISRLVVCGMMTHMCVDTTVRAAYDLGYECLVAGDCCATKKLVYSGKEIPAEYVQISFLAALHGIFSKVMDKEDVVSFLSQ